MGKHNGKARKSGMQVGAALMNRSKVRAFVATASHSGAELIE